ncbi:hypothetical protein NBO_73g0015 [Nosema bombycis CQ1]|uniref:Uncharacterized protein n=1 Tax=Nosema bombycis (strain CQ1 / CVCC 102059) TaxID=578461 RepID=R0M647_NOSB1|nr:hypothetical protein NBO_73g0015 [Nosema bombycis CQ1]|eukprot:EOB13449.1 hypothetical protein NBO_73g0015 [Nosema bombycis CQ1]
MEYETITLDLIDYISTNTPEEIASGVVFGSIPVVLTPFKSKSNDISFSLDLYDKQKQNVLRLTPTEFLKNKEIIFKNKQKMNHLIVEDLLLMKEFGYDKNILEIKSLGFNLIGSDSEYLTNPSPLSLNKFCIDCKEDLIYVSLFVLYKIYSKKNNKISIITPDKLKTEIFCRVMDMNCKIFGINDLLRNDLGENVIVVKSFLEVSAKRVVYLGSKPTGTKEIKMDYKKISKYIYRIRDLIKSITKDVLKGKREFNYGRFKNILK